MTRVVRVSVDPASSPEAVPGQCPGLLGWLTLRIMHHLPLGSHSVAEIKDSFIWDERGQGRVERSVIAIHGEESVESPS